jgi:hypothetical protein
MKEPNASKKRVIVLKAIVVAQAQRVTICKTRLHSILLVHSSFATNALRLKAAQKRKEETKLLILHFFFLSFFLVLLRDLEP